MALVAPVENGKIVETASQTSVKNPQNQAKAGWTRKHFTAPGSADEVSGSSGTHIQHRVHIPVCTVLTGRADAEYVQQHGLTESKLTGR